MIIEVKNLNKSYNIGFDNKVDILKNINLLIEEGDFIAIVGVSGSGKSKLLHLLGGLEKATSGEIIINDLDIVKMKDREISKLRKNTIGFVFQDFILEENKTALQNIYMPLMFSNVKMKEAKNKALELLEQVGLKEFAKTKVNILSGGQRQKIAIARALISNPKIILADEPTGNLDSKNASMILDLLSELNKKGFTILMVTHNLEQTKYCNKVISIKDGEIENIDNTKRKE